ncbi:MAG: NAD(P)H-dependent oxidoreductase [Candidatus Sphingomonas colombiensis]|nr:NAD(P)H-dependent oxidoreductase [Sphingomonas sp.]WEK42057.1 MAG: NAD(P)H-dependent oxidoreductase [Sphingomonas sp.]
MARNPRPLVVALGGTLKPESTTEKALALALRAAAAAGADTLLIAGPALDLPLYNPAETERGATARALVAALRRADGIILGSPGYHGTISGLVKNALDYVEDMRGDPLPYFHARPVGSVATGAGWQGAVNTLAALRNVVHALRGWNTPMGVAINTIECGFGADGACLDPKITDMLEQMGREIATTALRRAPMAELAA